ncbi:MAG: DUF6951 family protein [Acidimicrobiales bacterium]
MPSLVVKAGACGFTTRAEARCDDGTHVALAITTDCPNYRALPDELQEVDAFREIFGPKCEGDVWQACKTYSPHASCPVPIALLKLVEVAAGLALPQTASIEISA